MNQGDLWLLTIPFGVQGSLSVFDEFYLHYRRHVPKWERIGHPIDTFSLLACVCITLWLEPSFYAVVSFVLLSVISSIVITKDEWVHKDLATPLEMWVHAMLFVLHPIVCMSIGIIWFLDPNHLSLKIEAALLFMYMCYQIIYWNMLQKDPLEN
ncbi:MAG: hypothetical protein KDD48_00695 [Bdellovibrionales bacterium]|nr:hypothetical protein [Bdellovibrionales bacterium]